MLDYDGELPYSIWYQCKRCTHLFYDEKPKLYAHLKDKHGYANGEQKSNSTATTSKFWKSPPPLRLKDQIVVARPDIASISSGTDGEDNSEEMMLRLNNNNNNNENEKSQNLAFQRKNIRHFLKNNIPVQDSEQHPINNKIVGRANIVVPSCIEDLKRQLLKSDIDISEIRMDEEEAEEEEDGYTFENDEGDLVYADDSEEGNNHISSSRDFASESYEDQEEEDISEDHEECASTSNQSFYDHESAGHFLFENDEADVESEQNYEDNEHIVTPSFGMFDELYRHADDTAGSSDRANNASAQEGTFRKRKYFNPCKLCKKNFPSLSMLKKHAKTHLNEEGGSQHVCKFCFDLFNTSAALSKHLRIHTEENPNVCNICAKSFTSWATLRTHMKIHSGERPFGCPYDGCGQRFQTKSTLDSHLRIHTGARPHICPICKKSFRTSSPLYRHMRSVHKSERYPCDATHVNGDS